MHLCEIDPFVRFAANVHHNITPNQVKVTDCRIFYVEAGAAQIVIDGKTFQLEKNSLFYCCSGSIYSVKAAPDLRLLCVNFDLDRSYQQDTLPLPVYAQQEIWCEMPVYAPNVEGSTFLNSYLLVQDAAWLRSNLLEIVKAHNENTPLGNALCGSLLKTLLLQLHGAKQKDMPEKLAIVQTYIRNHYKENPTNKELGKLVGYHEYYLNRTFLAYTGMSLHEYLIKVRMEKAISLIRNTDLPLTAIAEEIGIQSYPHFSSCFKSAFGCSPSEYRRRHRGGI